MKTNRNDAQTLLQTIRLGFSAIAFVISTNAQAQQLAAPEKRPNILMIVADDMNWDSPGCFGGVAPEVTPHIDQLAREGIRFQHAYMNISICTPSRSALLSGAYPIHNGAEGFQRIRPGTPTLPSLLNQAGYLCGIIGKPLRQQELFRWSVTYRWQGVGDEDLWGRDPEVYRDFAHRFFSMSKASNQPFFLMANSHDPHRPFGGGAPDRDFQERAAASRQFRADEVMVPGFLPDLAPVREELAAYATSVRRLDDMVGTILNELDRAGLREDTMVIFLADHGMPFPGAKFNCYPNSVRSPWIIRWPGHVRPNSVDRDHLIASIDLYPTLLDAVGVEHNAVDGRSFLPLLEGQTQQNRNAVYVQFYHIHGADALPMRSLITKEFTYVFNPWANGTRRFPRLGGTSFEAMKTAALTDPALANRIRHLQYRSAEEFYDRSTDPHCLTNLAERPETTASPELAAARSSLQQWMHQVGDPALKAFNQLENPQALERFVLDYRNRAAKEVEALKPYEAKHKYRF